MTHTPAERKAAERARYKAEGKRRGDLWLTPERWSKLKRLGTDWLERAIDRAKEPK